MSLSALDAKMPPKNTGGILKSLRAVMKSPKHVTEALHGYIIPSEDAHQSEYIAPCDGRREFVSGFTGSRGQAAITEHDAALWTDGRYFLQARQQMDSNWELMKESFEGTPTLEKWLSEKVPHGGRIGIDPRLIPADRFRWLRHELITRGLVLLPVAENLVDIVWGAEKPADPSAAIFPLPTELTGKSWQEKIGDIRKEMLKNKAKILVLSALDEVAWTFNLRGADIDYNPVFFSYAIIGTNFINLFLNESKVSVEVLKHVSSYSSQNGSKFSEETDRLKVEIHPYDSVLDFLAKYAKEELTQPEDRVWLPLESTSQAISGILNDNQRLEISSPVLIMKATKNVVEMNGMRNAHLKDAVAHCEFLNWLETEMRGAKGDEVSRLSEVSVAKKFEELRKEQDGYVSLSFETISSVGAHAAVIHYSPSAETDVPLRADQIYLVDSGAQYRDGTTDVTRTVSFKEPTAYQKECNTLMVKGHIALATQIFPEGTTGMRMDSVARLYLWNFGLDFRHGVGHGVGHFLCVHEGPASVGYRTSNAAKEGIKENYVLTIEPGYYEDGQFGFRFENVYAVVSAKTKYSFPSCRFLTFKPMTLVPIQTNLLDPAMLTEKEISWINEYHEKCLEAVGPLLKMQGKTEAYKWLCENTKPLG